jgi:hypothetical protein
MGACQRQKICGQIVQPRHTENSMGQCAPAFISGMSENSPLARMPGSGTEDEHHSETFLMEQGYQDDESENKYSPQTIKRFRSTKNWQQP